MAFKILSIDGGGIRGIIPACVLVAVEKALQAKYDDPTRKVGDSFDMIAGTSTGGILTCLFLTPDPRQTKRARFSAAEALQLYLDNGDDIFDRSVWHAVRSLGTVIDEKYPAKGIEGVLAKYFGDVRLSELVKPCLVTAYDVKRYRPFFFTQPEAMKNPADDYRVRDVARATSAAPTYFEPALPESLDDIPNATPMVDGGVFANNPAACALVEAFKVGGGPKRADDIALLSLGTGRTPDHITYSQCKNWGLLGWAKPILGVMMEGVAQTVDYQLRLIFKSLGVPNQYLRIDGEFGDISNNLDVEGLDAAMDHADEQNMARLRAFGMQLAQNQADEIATFVQSHL